jgi:hypothetical protein
LSAIFESNDILSYLDVRVPSAIDGQNNALRTNRLGCARYKLWIFDSGSVNRYLVRARPQGLDDIIESPQAATDAEGYENLIGRILDDVQHGLSPFVGGCDIKEDKLISSLLIVALCEFYRIASCSEGNEFNAFHDECPVAIPIFDVKARNNPLCEHQSEVMLYLFKARCLLSPGGNPKPLMRDRRSRALAV